MAAIRRRSTGIRVFPVLLVAAQILLVGHALYPQERLIRMATTTSTENSGLLDILLPRFEEATGFEITVIAVGTGRALKYGETGDVDCVMVHAQAAEEAFVAAGFGIERVQFMHNTFVIVGPEDDPARVSQAESLHEAMRRIADTGNNNRRGSKKGTFFVSRGDESGTHLKEKTLWDTSVELPKRGWYFDAGQGMASVLVLASEMQAYTLTDRGTFLSLRDELDLIELYNTDPLLYNPYSIIAVNPEIHQHVNHSGVVALTAWLVSEEGKTLINSFQIGGEQLFYADHKEVP